MIERLARSLAEVLHGEAERAMTESSSWGVLAACRDGRFMAIEDAAGWAYFDRAAYEASQAQGDFVGLIDSQEDPDGGREVDHARCSRTSRSRWRVAGLKPEGTWSRQRSMKTISSVDWCWEDLMIRGGRLGSGLG